MHRVAKTRSKKNCTVGMTLKKKSGQGPSIHMLYKHTLNVTIPKDHIKIGLEKSGTLGGA